MWKPETRGADIRDGVEIAECVGLQDYLLFASIEIEGNNDVARDLDETRRRGRAGPAQQDTGFGFEYIATETSRERLRTDQTM